MPDPLSLFKAPARAWNRLRALVLEQARQGADPDKLALACALGLWVGIVPGLGVSTALCGLLALGLRLNQAVIQAVNFLVYPLQLALLFPFFGLGARVFGGPYIDLSPAEFLRQAGQHPWVLARRFWWVGLHALAVWAVLGPPVVAALWWALRRLFALLPFKERT